MKPAEIRHEVLKLCESFAKAAQTGDALVVNATAHCIRAEVMRLWPDIEKPKEPTVETEQQ